MLQNSAALYIILPLMWLVLNLEQHVHSIHDKRTPGIEEQMSELFDLICEVYALAVNDTL